MSHHCIEEIAFDMYPVVMQDDIVVLDILSYFQGFGIFQSRFEDVYDFPGFFLLLWNGNIIGLVLF